MLENDHAEREAVSPMPARPELVPFRGGTMQCVRDVAGGTWLVLKSACDALGVDFEAQRQRLDKQPWAVACVTQATGADGKRYGMYCLRSDRVAMWLATISIRRVRPELRQALALWQCEAADALARWAAGAASGATAPAALEAQVRQLVSAELARAGWPPLRAQRQSRPRSDTEHAFVRGYERATGLAGRALTVRELLGTMNEYGTELRELREAVQVLLRGERRTPEKALGYLCRSLSQTTRDGLCLVAERHTEHGCRWHVTRS